MKLKQLKIFRVVISLIFLLSCSFLFLDISHKLAPEVFDAVLYLQFIPSLIKFIGISGIAAGGFIFIIILTLLFGRVYCSAICPMGALQDIVSNISKKAVKRKKYRFKKPHNILRYSILTLTFLAFVAGSILLVNLLDPFSSFGRILSDLVRPVYLIGNNLLAAIFESFDTYYFYYIDVVAPDIEILLFPITILIVIVWFSIKYGRLYCNTICPVGALLGLLSKFSMFQIVFDRAACTSCGACERVCKSQCIDSGERELDISRCVSCFNCFKACPSDGFRYEFALAKKESATSPKAETDSYRRDLVLGAAGALIVAVGLREEGKANAKPQKSYPVTAPGSKSVEHFTENCIACHLCVSACPTFVLQPAFLAYGISGILQPRMDFAHSFCNYECTVCSNICPSGAILPLTTKEKITVQPGKVKFLKENCIVHTEGTDCGACAEHCPTRAVRMEPYGNLYAPVINDKVCVGCGACEHICPTVPNKAIYVDGNAIHLTADPPKFEKLDYDVDYQEDFPF